MSNQNASVESARAVAREVLNMVFGAYCSVFWDSFYEVTGSIDSIRELKGVFETLHASQNDKAAFQLLLVQIDLVGFEVPAEVLEVAPYDEAIKIFMEEFFEDTADLMLDYEAEESEKPAWK